MIKSKKIIATLACAIIVFMSMAPLCLAAEELDLKLNRRITFTGDTYWDWNGKKIRKDNNDTDEISAIVVSINKKKSKGIYVSALGKSGYIGMDQIKAVEGKVMELEFDKKTLTSTFKFDGEILKMESTNDHILEIDENGRFKAGIEEGSTTVTIYGTKGEVVKFDANVKNATVQINVEEKSVEIGVEDSSLVMKAPNKEEGTEAYTEILKTTASGNAKANLQLGENKVTINAEAKADGSLKVKGEEIIKAAVEGNGNITAERTENGFNVDAKANGNAKVDVKENEVLNAEVEGKANVDVDFKEGVTATGSTTQTYTILQKLKMKLNGEAAAMANKEGAGIVANGSAEVNDTEVVSGQGALSGNYGEDPEIEANASILGKEVVNVPTTKIPIVSMLKKLLKR